MSNEDYATIDELLKAIENKETDFVLVYKGKQGGIGIYHSGHLTTEVGLVSYATLYFKTIMGELIDEQLGY